MQEKLRRKGEGKTERPICPCCDDKKDLRRIYTRVYTPNKTLKPVGYVCLECEYVKLDKKESENNGNA